jgi:hypothetical protein
MCSNISQRHSGYLFSVDQQAEQGKNYTDIRKGRTAIMALSEPTGSRVKGNRVKSTALERVDQEHGSR